MDSITEVIRAIDAGSPQSTAQLLPLVYEELRRLAANQVLGEKPGQTLQPTALVHEAYLRLMGNDQKATWDHRGHFFAAAAEAMRRILVEQARRKQAVRHGGHWNRGPLGEVYSPEESPEDYLDIDEKLTQFAIVEPAKAELVKLRFFTGLSMPEVASVLGISLATAERWWVFARAWLFSELKKESLAQNISRTGEGGAANFSHG